MGWQQSGRQPLILHPHSERKEVDLVVHLLCLLIHTGVPAQGVTPRAQGGSSTSVYLIEIIILDTIS